MVAQILSDAGQLVAQRNAHFLQVVGGPDSGKQEELGGADCAAAADNFVALNYEHIAAALDLDANGPVAVEDETVGR